MIDQVESGEASGNVIYLKPRASKRMALWLTAQRANDATEFFWHGSSALLRTTLHACWQLARVTICALLALLEPIVRAVLVSFAFLALILTLIIGFWMGDPRFPKWGMLALSVGAVMLYWVFLWVVSLFMELPRDDCRY